MDITLLYKDLETIIINSGKNIQEVDKSLRKTLYLLLYCNYEENINITDEEIYLINNYNNKDEFINLFQLILSGAFSIKELYLDTHF
jgi:hypothetical protein